ncbi:MAG: phosphoribosylglycinamide formyltransferase [Clostridia bacterium]|nr:phosphoribosylglycinamide formyltransferase [Clostridia bacterium]
MVKTKIAVLVSGGGTNLQAILDSMRAGKIPHGEIALVISNNRNAYALTRARENGIETAVVSRRELGGEFEDVLLSTLAAHGIELVVLAGFLCVLTEKVTRAYAQRIINVHPSLIPSFCGTGYYGLKVHEAALAYGVKVTGATVHYVNEVTDGGEIIAQKAVEVKPGDTPETLQRRVMEEAEWVILPAAVEQVCKKLQGETI